MADRTVRLNIERQDNPNSKPYWEEFELRWRPGMNVISALMDIAMNPVDRHGKQTMPITYDSNCLEEVCGSCAMRINGRAAMACSSLIDKLEQPIRLEPLSRFPVVRDLAVDRSVLFENLKQVQAWVPIDGTYDLGAGPRIDPSGARTGLSAVTLHLLLPVHGSLSAIYRTDAIRWGGNHQSSAPFQPPSHRGPPPTRTLNSNDERWWNPRVQLRRELCADLPQEHSVDNIHFHCLWPSDEAGHWRLVPETGAHQRAKRTGEKMRRAASTTGSHQQTCSA